MQPKLTRRIAAAACALALAFPAGCAASSDYMRESVAPTLRAEPDKALVVFIRPSGYASGIATTILDDAGHFLGDSLAGSYFVVEVEPGERLFISWAENTAALSATLVAGKIYYVEVSPTLGAWSARVHLLALTPRSENWSELRGWLADSTFMDVDRRAGQAYLDGREEDVAEQLRAAREALADYDAEERAARTLRAGDGQ